MSIGTDLRTYLLSKASITALVDQAIYPDEAKQGYPFPRILYTENGGMRTNSFDGANPQVQTSFTLLCQSEDSDEAKSIRDALENVLDCFSNDLMDSTTVQGVFSTRNPDGLIPPTAGNENSVYESSITIDLWYESTVPSYA